MRPVPALAALALAGLTAPTAHALTLEDDTLKVAVKMQIQTRASLLNDAEGANGADYDPLRGSAGEAEAARFSVRRARLGFGVAWGEWRGNFWLRAAEGSDFGGTDTTRGAQLFYANVARVFTTGGVSHDIHAGLDKPFNGESSLGSTLYALPTERITSMVAAVRGVGVGYGLRSDFVNFGVDVQNNTTTTKDVDAADETNGWFYSTRVEVMPGKDHNPGKRQESYLGKAGTHALLGIDAQWNDSDLTSDAVASTFTITDTFTWGPDLLVHWNALTCLAELRLRTTDLEDETGASDDFDSRWFIVQAAYAFPLANGTVVEPVVRYSVADVDVDADTAVTGYANAATGNLPASWYVDNGGDGSTIDIGLSWYLAGHGNKLQAAYQLWEAEEGDATASIVRVQHQLAF